MPSKRNLIQPTVPKEEATATPPPPPRSQPATGSSPRPKRWYDHLLPGLFP